MAKCEKIEVKPVPHPAEYQLTLNEGEACVLRQLLSHHVAGAGCGPLTAIEHALKAADVGLGRHVIVRRNWGPDDVVLLVNHL
jgi:hypothetical protein